MKPETEKRLAERLGFHVEGHTLFYGEHPVGVRISHNFVALWQLCGELMEEDGWVKCSERLPEVGSTVLAWKPSRGFQIVEFSEEARKHVTLIRSDGQWWNLGNQITHWRPLPHPPEGE